MSFLGHGIYMLCAELTRLLPIFYLFVVIRTIITHPFNIVGYVMQLVVLKQAQQFK